MNSIPIFKSHFSFGKSILTLEDKDENSGHDPDSIFPLLDSAGLKELFLVDDYFAGFLEANKNCQKRGIKLNYGLRMTLCDNADQKDEDSLKTNSKVIIFGKNRQAYQDLIKIYTKASIEGFYYEARTDCKSLKELWTDNLMLVFPFYDSYLFNNILTNRICCPDIFCEALYFREDNDLPFDDIINQKLDSMGVETLKTQTIYYANKKDFPAYLTARCLNKRTILDKPNLDHMSSDNFSFEKWKQDNED